MAISAILARAKRGLCDYSIGDSAMPRTSEEYVLMAYRVLLRREIDAAGLRAWRERIASGNFREQSVINTILGSDEYRTRFGIDLLPIVHSARQTWIRTLAPFERILDIGGSSPTRPEGAKIGRAHV